MDGRGVPLSLIVTAANVNDGKRINEVLSAIVVQRARTPMRRNKHLCADAGYRSAENLRIIERHGIQKVEELIDHCLSLENLIDPWAAFSGRHQPRVDKEDEEPYEVPKLAAKRISKYGLAGWIGIQDTPREFTDFVKADIGKWSAVIERAGIAKHD